MMPKVAFQVVSYWSKEGEQDLEALRCSLEAVDYPHDRWRIVVIDNPSPHGRALEYLKREWLSRSGTTLPEVELVVNEHNTGFAGGHMSGFTAAKRWAADYLYISNQDASVAPDFLTRIVLRAEQEPETALWQSQLLLKQTPNVLNSAGNALHFLGFGYCIGYKQTVEEAERNRPPMFYASGAAMLVRVSVLPRIGLFDERYFMYHEDVDLAWRARLAGFGVGYVKESIAYHRYEFSRSIKKFYWMERNRHLTNLVNYKISTLFLIAPAVLIMELGTFGFAIKSGWWKEKLRAWLFFTRPSTWVMIIHRRRFVQTMRRRTDQEMLSQMVGIIDAQEVQNPLMRFVANPLLQIYFWFVKALVRW